MTIRHIDSVSYQGTKVFLNTGFGSICSLLFFTIVFILGGCAVKPEPKGPETHQADGSYPPGTIISSLKKAPVSFEELITDLSRARIVYIGERHTVNGHHQVQLKVLAELRQHHPNLAVGMEMFATTYQGVLDRWTRGELERRSFLQQTHWYANWRYNFELYAEILDFIQSNRIPAFGLNIPSHIPAKISIGGVGSLSEHEKSRLPQKINTSDPGHRAYVRKVFEGHRIRGRDDFEFFYTAQCVWEDIMAESIARHLEDHFMVVLAGNGHITHKFGVPNRAYELTGVDFRTIMPVSAGPAAIDLSSSDYIWVTP